MKRVPNLSLVYNGPSTEIEAKACAVNLDGFSAYYGKNCILSDVNLKLPKKGVTSLVGPSGTGKSTILRWLNRINEDTEKATFSGTMKVLDRDILTGYPDVTELRRRVGMVFQQPCVFPCSIYDNMLMGLRHRKLSKTEARDLVEEYA